MPNSNRLQRDATRLVRWFDAETLGGGDLDTGANVLAAMALTIANLQRPHSVLRLLPSGLPIDVGGNLLVCGGLSSKLVADMVLAPLQSAQNNVAANIRVWARYEDRRLKDLLRIGREADFDPDDPPEPALSGLARLQHDDELEQVQGCTRLMETPVGGGIAELRGNPLAYASAGSAEEVRRALPLAHLGRLLAHIPLEQADDCAAYRKPAGQLTGGCQVFEPHLRGVRGEVLVTDPAGAVRQALQSGAAGTDWLDRCLWLADHAAGPSFEPEEPAAATEKPQAAEPKLDNIVHRFDLALRLSLARRWNVGSVPPREIRIAAPLSLQRTWLDFLRHQEAVLPGISGSLATLPASLCYGLHWIQDGKRARLNDVAPHYMQLVQAFAAMLVLRMANARALMVQDGRRARLESLAAAVRRKLADGPLSVRELVRKSHRLQAAECEEALELLLLRGQVQRAGNCWALLSQTAVQPQPQPQPLVLNV